MTDRIQQKYYVGRPNIGDTDSFLKRASDILDDYWLTNDGPLVQELESKISRYLGVKECVLVANGTLGIQLAARALELKGEVILPAMTFVATAHALEWIGIKPVFVDIDRHTYNICPERVAKAITKETSGVIGVHLFGRPCDVQKLQRIASEEGISLMFDAAHSFGSEYRGTRVGNFGRCEVFSFHATKIFNTFEGGAITTDCAKLAEKLRKMRNFGFAGEDLVTSLGVNAKMPEINAAMGLTNLEKLDDFIRINVDNYRSYCHNLKDIPGITIAEPSPEEKNNHHYLILEIDPNESKVSRDELKDKLTENGVLARRYFYPGCHRMEPYASQIENQQLKLDDTDEVNERILALPTGTQIDHQEIQQICDLIRGIAGHC